MNDLTTTQARSPTHFSADTLSAVARWTRDIDATVFYMPGDVPPDAGPSLISASLEHIRALTPAQPHEITRLLMAMRSSTQRRNETADEAEASFRALVASLADTPADIVEEACRLYVRVEKFFPRAPAEILRFSEPLLTQRRRRAINLAALSRQAEENRKRMEELANPTMATIDDLRELAGNPFVSRSVLWLYVDKGWATKADVEQVLAEADPEPEPPSQ